MTERMQIEEAEKLLSMHDLKINIIINNPTNPYD